MSAMSLISLCSLSLPGAEFRFIASSTWGFGSIIALPRREQLCACFFGKPAREVARLLGQKRSRFLISGWILLQLGLCIAGRFGRVEVWRILQVLIHGRYLC